MLEITSNGRDFDLAIIENVVEKSSFDEINDFIMGLREKMISIKIKTFETFLKNELSNSTSNADGMGWTRREMSAMINKAYANFDKQRKLSCDSRIPLSTDDGLQKMIKKYTIGRMGDVYFRESDLKRFMVHIGLYLGSDEVNSEIENRQSFATRTARECGYLTGKCNPLHKITTDGAMYIINHPDFELFVSHSKTFNSDYIRSETL